VEDNHTDKSDEEPLEDNDDRDRDILFKGVTDDHENRKEREIAPLDALYPTRVSSNDEKQQTLHRMSAMPEST
jgi:hypothetical protein